jgi:hypothetical protein
LLVHTDGKGALISRLLYLPDRRRKMEARPFTILAGLESTLQFQQGMLSSSKVVVDSTQVAKAAVQAAEKFAAMMAANVGAAEKAARERLIPAPQIYRLEFDTDENGPVSVRFVGAPGTAVVRVSL